MFSLGMFSDFSEFAQAVGILLDGVGVVVIAGGALLSTAAVAVTLMRRRGIHHLYKTYRNNLARSIILGLEFLVAGDIIRSVAGDLSLDSVIILAVIILIRGLLGIQFEMEIEGRWPWKRGKSQTDTL